MTLCKIYRCPEVGYNLCCSECTLPCRGRCLNSPDRCSCVSALRASCYVRPGRLIIKEGAEHGE